VTAPWIPEPGGPYVVPEADYHADKTALSSSGARTLTTSCPEGFKWEREHGRPDKPHFDEGRAAHAQLLGIGSPLYVPCSDQLDDEGKPKPYARWDTNAAKAKVAAARARGETPVKADVAQRVKAMAEKLRRHETAGPLFARPGKAEQTFVARDPDTNVLCKIRCDWMPDVEPGQRLIIVDYKGTTCAQPKAFERRLAEFGYDQQGAFYTDVLTWRYGLDVSPVFIIVAQEKEAPYLVSVCEPRPYVIDGGRELNREALAAYARCTLLDEWPGYDPGVAYLDVPGWRTAAYEAAADRRHNLIGASA
jgi:hypothetical protein